MYYIVKKEWVKDFSDEQDLLDALIEEVQSYTNIYYPNYSLKVQGEWQGDFFQESCMNFKGVDEWVCDLIKKVLCESFY